MEWLLRPEGVPQELLVMVIAIGLFALVMAVVLLVVDRPGLPRWVPVLGYLGPALLLIAFGLLLPGLTTIWQSFLGKDKETFVAFSNYAEIFTNADFIRVLINTALWVILVPLVSTALGLVYAVLVDRIRGEKLAKAMMFLPMAISMVGASIIWKFVYQYKPAGANQIGLLNQLLVWVGLPPQNFLLNPPGNTFALIFVMIWIQTGFAMTVLSAAIKAISDDIIEAAKMDGVSGLRMFFNITLPSVRPAVIVVITTIAMATLKAFDVVSTMTGGQFKTSVIAYEFFTQSFTQGQPNIGAAMAVLLFLLVSPIVIYNVRSMRISEGER